MSLIPELLQYTEEDRCQILADFQRSPDCVKKDVELLQNWLESQPQLPKIFSERRIERFLMMNKMYLEETKMKIRNYFLCRKVFPDIFKFPMDPSMENVADTSDFVLLPKLIEGRDRVAIWRCNCQNDDQFDFKNAISHMYNTMELVLENDYFSSAILIYDFENLDMESISQFSPIALKRLHTSVEMAYTTRIKTIHIVNCSPSATLGINILKKALKLKLAVRVINHDKITTLYSYIPKELLPVEYGGFYLTIPELKEKWDSAMAEYQPWFEKLRTVQTETVWPEYWSCDFLRCEQNFRQLDID